tara:strand:+ start:27 stop:584 length:558 start_codon:yes stop_codon:yes gene_type:complete
MVLQSLQSPLLWLQETNTDVWEYLMISLVKVRKNKVLEELDKVWKTVHERLNSRSEYEEYLNTFKVIHYGRIAALINSVGWFGGRLYPLTERVCISHTKYFVHGFKLYSSSIYSFYPSYPPKMSLSNINTVVNILTTLSRLNNFKFPINDDTTDYDIVKILYERERLGTDKYIYCSIENNIISLD